MFRQAMMTAPRHPVSGRRGHWAITTVALALLAAPALGLAAGVAKSQWLDQMETAVPSNFCGEQQYFRQCFDVDANTCKRTMASAARDCIGQIESDVPAELDGQSRQKWGERVGECAAQAYETNLASQRVDSKRCNNADNWL